MMAAEIVTPSHGLYGKRTPLCFASPRGMECAGEVADTLLLTPLASGREALVNLSLVYYNGHVCTARDAVGKWQGDALLVTLDDPKTCRFRITFSASGATLADDPDLPCRTQICGARGVLDGVTLPLKGAL